MLLASNFCEETVNAWKLAGLGLMIIKIGVPLIISITGIIPLATVVTTGKAEDLIIAVRKLFFKLIAAFIVFLVPTIIPIVINLLAEQKENANMNLCTACLNAPTGPECESKDAYENVDPDIEQERIDGNLDTSKMSDSSTSDDDDEDYYDE